MSKRVEKPPQLTAGRVGSKRIAPVTAVRNPGDKARSIDESILDSQIDLMSEEHSGSSLTDLK